MRPTIAILLVIPFLAGCPQLDVLEGKTSPYQVHVEQQAAVAAPVPEEPKPAEPAPMLLSMTAAPCYDEWRVIRCVDGVATDWATGEPL